MTKYLLPAILLLAVVGRVIFLPNPGFEADISFWKSWGLAQYDHGIVWSIKNTNNNYPTPFSYTLGVLTWVYSFFADPHDFNQYWSNNNMLFLTIAKMPAVLADFGIAAIILWLGKNAKKLGFPQLPMTVYIILAGLYLVNPVSIMDGAWWGQVDSLGVFVYLLAVVALLYKKPFLAGVIYMTSMMTKLQNMIYGPLFFILSWQLLGFQGLVRTIAGSTFAFFGLNIEFFIASEMRLVIASLTQNYDYFPLMSLNAYNLWWIVAKGVGMKVSDKYLALGLINAKTMGLYLFITSYLTAAIHMVTPTIQKIFQNKSNLHTPVDEQTILSNYFGALIIVAGGFFLFQTQSHDRYAFPIAVFLLLWGVFYIYSRLTRSQREDVINTVVFKRFALCYIAFSLIYFYNLHTAMVANYPHNGLPLLSDLNTPPFTIAASIVQLVLFLLFLYVLKRETRLTTYSIPIALLVLLVGVANAPLLFKKSVYVSSLTPIASQQDYSTRQSDMSTNASFGFNSWSPLSDQYYFYRHGIGTHAKSYHIYDIGGHFKRLTTDYGIDTEAGAGGDGTFEIYGDDKLLFSSDKMGRFDLPKHADVDLTSVKKLGLITGDGGDNNNDDHTDWLNTKLWP